MLEFRPVTRLSWRGYPFTVWEPVMPRVLDRLTDCAIYLYRSEAEALAGERTGGSGFLFGIEAETQGSFVYAVSNWHVVRDSPVVRLNTEDGGIDVMPLTTANWFRHPDHETDLAVAPLATKMASKYRAIVVNHHNLLIRQWINNFNIGIGEDLFMVGRFIDHDGVQHNKPTVRFGALAQMPGNSIETEIGHQDAFLAEMHSISGFSGSPVFALVPRYRDFRLTHAQRAENPIRNDSYGEREAILLLGIDCGHLTYLDDNVSHGNHQPLLYTKVNTGMAIVIGAWKLDELLNRKELKDMRDKENKRRLDAVSHTALDDASPRPKMQKTTAPKEEDRIEIPIPSRDQFMSDLKKATRKRKQP